jgi:murein L,D-transpeptidase YafK
MTCNPMGRMLLALLACVTIATQPACAGKEDRIRKAFRTFPGPFAVYVNKKEFRMEVYNRHMEVVSTYVIGYGSNPDMKAKLHEGDNRTPEGVYAVNEILSMDAEKTSPTYRTLSDINKKYFRAKDGHSKFGEPGVDLGDNAYGPRYFGLDYPNAEDRKRYGSALKMGALPLDGDTTPGIGYGIAIHGNNDENSVGHLSSNGCIRMYNRDIVEFEQYIRLGTPVIISAD